MENQVCYIFSTSGKNYNAQIDTSNYELYKRSIFKAFGNTVNS